MLSDVNLWPLIGVAIIIVGFVLRFNPMLVVIVTAVGTALAAGFPIDKILATKLQDNVIETLQDE